ncbi:hypothetical protein JCM8202_005499 [Rhodotorula sphaerocarpa]
MGFAAFPSTYETLSPLLHERYLLLEEIGVGGSGFVLKVQERQAPGRVLAAKLIARERIARSGLIRTSRWGSVPPGLEADQDGMLVVPVEAWAMRRVAHPNVCGFEELFADEMFYYLIMEYHGTSWSPPPPEMSLPPSPPITPPGAYLDLAPTAPPTADLAAAAAAAAACPSPSLLPPRPPPLLRRTSSDLFEAVERRRNFDDRTARHIFRQIVDAVCGLAQVGILHRDLKDENITLAEDSLQVKLVDFGSCVLFNPQGPPPTHAGHRFYGTWTYAAPEIFAGQAYALLPAEVWSLGVLLHVLLTGENPFSSAEDARLGRRIRTRVRMGAEAERVVERCLEVEVERRVGLEELRRDLWVMGVEAPWTGVTSA